MGTKIVKRDRGRPTKYSPEVFPKIEEYISSCGREQTSLPTIEGLALYLGITKETVYQWDKEYPDFSDAVKKILMIQKKQLIDDGMYGGKEVNATMAIFLLKVNHNMREEPVVLQQFNNQGITYVIQVTKNEKEFNDATPEPVAGLSKPEEK